MPGLDFLNILDKDKIYGQEGSALSDDRKSIDFDLGDRARHLGAMILGRGDEFSQEALLKGARKEFVDTYNENRSGDRSIIQQGLEGTNVNTGSLLLPETGISVKDQDNKIKELNRVATGVINAENADPEYFDRSNVSTFGDITKERRRAINEGNSDLTNPTSRASITKDKETANDRLTLAENRAAFDRAENRKMQAHQFDMNMLNKNAQLDLQRLELAGRREDRRMAREDRQADKRQASIMMLIKGLTQLGAGFSI